MKVSAQEDVSPLIRASLSSLNSFGVLLIFFSGLNPTGYACTDWDLLFFHETWVTNELATLD